MINENEPISDDEQLLRRVHRQYFTLSRQPLISPNAFEPRFKGRAPDVDGISLFRKACLPSPEAILALLPSDKRKDHGIVAISVACIKSLGLTVVSKPIS